MNLAKIGLIFDMDGVIVNNHAFHFKSWQAFAEKYGFVLNEADYKKNINGTVMKSAINYLFGEALDYKKAKMLADEKESVYRKLYAPYLKPLDGLIPFLEAAKEKDVKIAVGTSAPPENVTFTLDGLNIRKYFDEIVDATMVHLGKPNPEVYLKCAEKIEKNPNNCIVFEDAISGVQAGLAAGCKVVGVATTHSAGELAETHLTIKDFESFDLIKANELFNQI